MCSHEDELGQELGPGLAVAMRKEGKRKSNELWDPLVSAATVGSGCRPIDQPGLNTKRD